MDEMGCLGTEEAALSPHSIVRNGIIGPLTPNSSQKQNSTLGRTMSALQIGVVSSDILDTMGGHRRSCDLFVNESLISTMLSWISAIQ